MTYITAPSLDDGKQLVSATVYGQHLYVAETPITDGVLTLHATDVNALIELKDYDTSLWVEHTITMDKSVMDAIAPQSARVALVTTKIRNPMISDPIA